MQRETLIQNIVESLTRSQRIAKPSMWNNLGLSHAQASMLFMLSYHENANVKQISEYLGISKSAVSQLLDPLVDKGFVSRQRDPKDRRVTHLRLTDDAITLIKKLNRLKFAGIRTALDTLSDHDLKTLADLHEKISCNISKVQEP